MFFFNFKINIFECEKIWFIEYKIVKFFCLMVNKGKEILIEYY